MECFVFEQHICPKGCSDVLVFISINQNTWFSVWACICALMLFSAWLAQFYHIGYPVLPVFRMSVCFPYCFVLITTYHCLKYCLPTAEIVVADHRAYAVISQMVGYL